MPEQPGTRRCEAYLFDSFEASLTLGTLLRRGERLKVQDLPFKMLVVLLERPGELVTKEELANHLWGQEIFTEIDQGIYVMANKLRDVLGDDANHPRFIKTVSGKGYRFIAAVTPVYTPALIARLSPNSTETVSTESVERSQMARTSMRAAIGIMASAGVIFAAFATGFAMYKYGHRELMNGQDKVAVAAFTNSTGNPNLDETLSAAIQSQLQESPYLSLIADRSFRALLKNPESASLNDELRACTTLDAQVLLKGRISAVPPGYQVALTAWRCASGQLLTTQKADASSQAAILPALDLATEHMRRRLGEPEASLKKFNVPAVQATTASLAALKAFNFATEKRLAGDLNAAIASYKLAIDLDPQFALAYARLGMIYYNSGQFALGANSFQQAFELRSSRASDRERLYIVAHYYEFATGQIQRSIEVNELWHTLYPRDTVPMHNLATKYLFMGHPQPALDLARQAIQQEPNIAMHYELLAGAYLSLGDYSNVKKMCDDPVHGKIDSATFHRFCFDSAFALHDEAAMQRELQWAHGNAVECEAIADSAWVAMYYGKLSEARMLFHEAEQAAMRSKLTELAADIGLDEAMLEAEVGLLPAARAHVQRVLQFPFEGASEQAYAARALARSGDTSLALTLAKKAESMAPLDDVVQSAMLPLARAAIELRKPNPAGALDALKSREFDLCCRQLVLGYYRGLAYLENKQPELAVREFQQVIDHRFLSSSFSTYLVLAQLELGHAYMLLGDSGSANTAFAKVELAWKGADRNFPPLEKLRRYREQSALR
jgi:eukaryotic-like serine/threonine-protein kinase